MNTCDNKNTVFMECECRPNKQKTTTTHPSPNRKTNNARMRSEFRRFDLNALKFRPRRTRPNSSDDEGDEGTQPANINELFDYALELLWTLVTENGWDQTKLPDIAEGFSYVSIIQK